jgi:hypothetical protein
LDASCFPFVKTLFGEKPKKTTKMIPMRAAVKANLNKDLSKDIIKTTATVAISKAIKGCPIISDNNESTKKTPFFSNLMNIASVFQMDI